MSEIRLPNLFIIGAMKGGTTTLADHLSKSSDIEFFAGKEAHIFNEPDRRGVDRRISEESWRGSRTARFVLDGTPNYTRAIDGKSADLIKETLSETPKFIYLLRNPLERTISHYFWARERYGESLSFIEAVQQDPQYIEPSLYPVHINKYLSIFDKRDFLFLDFHNFIADTEGTVRRVTQWLGALPPDSIETGIQHAATRKDVTRDAKYPTLMRAIRRNRWMVERIKKVVPDRQIKSVMRFMTREVPRSQISDEDRTFVQERYFSSVAADTEALTGLNLNHWNR